MAQIDTFELTRLAYYMGYIRSSIIMGRTQDALDALDACNKWYDSLMNRTTPEQDNAYQATDFS